MTVRYFSICFVLFAVVLCLARPEAHAQDEESCEFTSGTIESGTYRARGTTFTACGGTIPAGADVTVNASETVRLKPGFRAKAGSQFRAQIESDAGFALSDMPPAEGNDRFFNDRISEVQHPSLSLNGFDSGSTPSHGFGLKQILEKRYAGQTPASIQKVYDRMVQRASDALVDASNRGDVYQNTQIMQARAFVALAIYVSKQNGEANVVKKDLPTDINTTEKATDSLRASLTHTRDWRIVKDWNNDGVKWTMILGNMSRALDLYLALENAYCYYGNDGHIPSRKECTGSASNRLLSKSQKKGVFRHFGNQIATLEESSEWKFPVVIEEVISRYHAESGNAPLKIQSAIGYASLTQQSVEAGFHAIFTRRYLNRALSANFRPAGDNRRRYWGYQTDDGKRFWAEGAYYMHFAMGDVLPFWHAARVNGLLEDHDFPDPFRHERFTTPLGWLADIVTPGGRTPPLDDGNKHNMRFSSIMRWKGSYGDGELGQKYAWISERRANPGIPGPDNLLPVEIAIPRVEGSGTPPANTVGNTSASQTGENGEQQVVIRKKDETGKTHYVLLNGESGDAYRRGEGHEQPDQLQLLYYVGETSYLMDTGYDNAAGPDVSTWNNYYDHNVMRGIHGFEGGLRNPHVSELKGRMKIDIKNVSKIYKKSNGKIDIIKGKQILPNAMYRVTGEQDGRAKYKRDIVFVGGKNPYVIDFSRIKHNIFPEIIKDRFFAVGYHINSPVYPNNFDPRDGSFISFNITESNKKFNVYPLNLKYISKSENGDIHMNSSQAEERNGPSEMISRMDVRSYIWPASGGSIQYFPVATVLRPNERTSTHAPKVLAEEFDKDYQGWVWKQGEETYDVFIARNTKSGTGGIIRQSLKQASSQYPSFSVELPAGRRYGFARVHKEGGEWTINSQYKVNLRRASLQATLQGPPALIVGDEGTWTAEVTGGHPGTPSYEWEYKSRNASWNNLDCSGSSCTVDFLSKGTKTLRVTVTKEGETSTATAGVAVTEDPTGDCEDDVFVCPVASAKSGEGRRNVVRLRGPTVDMKKDGAVEVTWSTSSALPPSQFAVEHRLDSTATWSKLGTRSVTDSVQTDTVSGPSYRFRTEDMEVGTHQFRLRLAGISTKGSNVSKTVSGKVALEEAYRLSAYPNPVREQATVELAVQERQDVTVQLYDVLGRSVNTLYDGTLRGQDTKWLSIDVGRTGMASGTYFLRVRGEEFVATERVTVVK